MCSIKKRAPEHSFFYRSRYWSIAFLLTVLFCVEIFPSVSIGIRYPKFILDSIAASSIQFFTGKETFTFEPFFMFKYIFFGLNLYT